MSLTVKIMKYRTSGDADAEQFSSADFWEKYSELEVTDYLVEEDLIIEQSIEYTSALEMQDSQVDLILLYNSTVWAFLQDEEYLGSDQRAYAVEITDGSDNILWHALDKFATLHDEINNRIELKTIGWYKYWLDSFGHKTIAFVSGTTDGDTVEMDDYLENYFISDGREDVISSINVDVINASLTLDSFFMRTSLQLYGMTIADFMIELQKHYGAYCYIDADRVLNFVCRGMHPSSFTAIDDLLIDEDYTIEHESEFNSVLVNGELSVDDSWTGDTFLLFYNLGDDVISVSDVDAISSKYKYIDIRQKLYGATFTYATIWLLFDPTSIPSYYDNINNYWDLYENLLGVLEVVNCEVLGTSYRLFNGVKIDSNEYTIFEVEANYTQNRSRLILKRLLPRNSWTEAQA